MRDSLISTELHCHLEGAIPPFWLYNTGKKNNIIDNTLSYESFYNTIVLKKPLNSLEQVLKYFDLIGTFLNSEQILFDATLEVCRSIHESGIKNIELRYAPLMLQHYTKLSFDESLDIIKESVTKAKSKFGVNIGLIAIGERNFGIDKIVNVIEWSIINKKDLIGVDLANREDGFNPKDFESVFNEVHKTELGITIHCGESGFTETVRECINIIKPHRIGHGIQIAKDRQIMELVKDLNITLEFCPISNYITKSVTTPHKHPLKYFLLEGLPVTLNTDDPGLFDITIQDEIEFNKNYLGITDDDLHILDENAKRASFLKIK